MAPKNRSAKKVSFPVSKSERTAVSYPVARIQRNLHKGSLSDRISTGGAIYLAGVLEYLAAEVLELAGDSAKANKIHRIKTRHIMTTINDDSELDKLRKNNEISCGCVMPVEQHEEQRQKVYKEANPTEEKCDHSKEMEVQSEDD